MVDWGTTSSVDDANILQQCDRRSAPSMNRGPIVKYRGSRSTSGWVLNIRISSQFSPQYLQGSIFLLNDGSIGLRAI